MRPSGSDRMNILFVFPHPDDGAMNAGGAMARWAAEGHRVTAVCCTGGGLGTLRTDRTSAAVVAQRAAELRAAHAILGVAETLLLDFPDGSLREAGGLREALVRCVRRFRPDRVITMDPWVRYEVHSDHIAAGHAAADAAAFAAFPLLFPQHRSEGLAPHAVGEVWFMGLLGDRPNRFVDIDRYLDRKAEALLKFEATFEIIDDMLRDVAPAGPEPAPEDARGRTEAALRGLARRMGAAAGLAAAEAFIALRCVPGHFTNLPDLYAQMLGEPRQPPVVE